MRSLKNHEYRSKKGNRIIVMKENQTHLLLTVINPETDYASSHIMTRKEFDSHEKNGELSFVHVKLFNCDFSKL